MASIKFLCNKSWPGYSVHDLLESRVASIAVYMRRQSNQYIQTSIKARAAHTHMKSVIASERFDARIASEISITRLSQHTTDSSGDYRFDNTMVYPNGAFQALRTDYRLSGMTYGRVYNEDSDSELELDFMDDSY